MSDPTPTPEEIAERALPCEAPGECPHHGVKCPNCDARPAVTAALREYGEARAREARREAIEGCESIVEEQMHVTFKGDDTLLMLKTIFSRIGRLGERGREGEG